MAGDFNPDDWPNDYSNPKAIQAEFSAVRLRIEEIKKQLRIRVPDYWLIGLVLAMILSWSRNGSILYCIGHGIASWIYVVYFAFTR